MKRAGWVIAVVFVAVCIATGQSRSFRGTVVRMKMSECTRLHGFVSAMSGAQVVTTQACPEYTVMTDRVVYVLVGRKPEEFIPLAENVTFHVRKSDVVVVLEDEKEESHFAVRQMTLREEWERDQLTLMAERGANYDTRSAPRNAIIQTSSQ
ncbi:MAG TPA: hypothetical protein VMT82_05895 [candidate division Zixibacteria bacterium]|nr:hypothetical protein [candidate division Zixibacteria bacterium]